MPWKKTDADRRRDAQTYDSAEYRRNRPIAMRRDKWRCQLRYQGCTGTASQCDHIIRPEDGGSNDLANLRAVCKTCHGKRTAEQGNEARKGKPKNADPAPTSRIIWE